METGVYRIATTKRRLPRVTSPMRTARSLTVLCLGAVRCLVNGGRHPA